MPNSEEAEILRRLSKIEQRVEEIATSGAWSIIGYAVAVIIGLQVIILWVVAG